MNVINRKLAVVTGASTGIGLELARLCAQRGFDLIIAADEPSLGDAARELRKIGTTCTAVPCDLATPQGIARLTSVIANGGRPVDFLFATAGLDLRHAFRGQDSREAIRAIHTNIDGTVRLIFALVSAMRVRGHGRVLITGALAGLMPDTFQAVHDGAKTFLDSFAEALSTELKGSGVTVTCLMPGATEMSAAQVARSGFSAVMAAKLAVVTGFARPQTATVGKNRPSASQRPSH
jgi:short-subunit dehydrogenase